MMPLQRLDKYICSQTMQSRRQADGSIRRGRVTVDGEVCKDPSRKIDPDTTKVCVDGNMLTYAKFVYYMLHKPAGILCVSRDPKAKTVVDLLKPADRRKDIFPAGRLDKDTTGLVLLTDDGDLAHRILAPKNHIMKRYHAVLDGPIEDKHIAAFKNGITLADGTPCLPADLTVLENGENPLVEITICEGKYHQIKRMFGVIDRGVNRLKRLSMGGLQLDENLKECEYRSLDEQEISLLFKEC